MRWVHAPGVILAMGLSATAGRAGAEDDPNAPDGEAVAPVEDATALVDDSGDLRIGSFLLFPTLLISEFFDDNIFATRNNKAEDFVTLMSPAFRLESDWIEHGLNLFGSLDVARYGDHGSEDYVDWQAGGDGRIDITTDINLFGGGTFSHDHESRDSPDGVNGIEPTTYDETYGFAGVSGQFDSLSARLAGTYRHLDFDDVPTTAGIINNDDRDRTLYDLGTRIGYEVDDGRELFVQGAGDFRRYDAPVDDAGVNRDSDGFGAALGMNFAFEDNARLELLAGYLYQNYADPTLDDVGAMDFGVRLNLQPTFQTAISATVDRTVNETTATGASSYLSTRFGASVEHLFAPDLSGNASAYYTMNDYVGIDRRDQLMNVGMGLAHYLSPHVWVGTDYSYLHRDSEAAGEDYDENRIFLRIGAQWSPQYSDADMAAYRAGMGSGPDLGGFYVGAQAGFGELYSGLEGLRGMGAGGSLTADFGNHGWTGGVFGGYGDRWQNWYLAGELDAELSGAEWSHARLPGGRVFMTDKQYSFGASGLLGYYLPWDGLVYGRFGVVGTSLETTYTTGGMTNVRSHIEPGLRFGAGTEAPIGGGAFIRLEHTYTAYRDYDMPGGPGMDSFSPTESMTRLGVGYRFGAPANGEDEDAGGTNPFSGFYAGGQLGQGSLVSLNTGPRQAGSALVADRGGFGQSAGVFGGYGIRFGDFYLAGELDADLSDTSWNIERDPNGRVYEVDRHYGVGGSLIAGYVVDEAALLYGRIGVVQAGFRTKYAVGANAVDVTESQTGLRAGSGIEIPASETVSLRFDYSYTEYEDYQIDYGAGVDSFENSESQFKIGVAFRF